MYHYFYEIIIFSDSQQLENVLKNISFPERLEFSAKTYPVSEFLSFSCNGSSIIILNLPENVLENNKIALLQKCFEIAKEFPNIEIILCADHSTVNNLTGQYLRLVEEIWINPLTDSLICFQYKKLFHKIKLQKDCQMTQTYLDTLINSIPDLVWFKDIRGAHLKVNDSFGKAVGKTKEDCEGRGHYYIWDLKQEEYAKGEFVCLETEEIVLRERKTSLFDEKVKSKEGMRQFKTYKSPIFDENKELIGTVGIAHDVTDFDNIGAELEIILGSLPFGALALDADSKVVNVNDKFLEYFKINKEDILYTDCRQSPR